MKTEFIRDLLRQRLEYMKPVLNSMQYNSLLNTVNTLSFDKLLELDGFYFESEYCKYVTEKLSGTKSIRGDNKTDLDFNTSNVKVYDKLKEKEAVEINSLLGMIANSFSIDRSEYEDDSEIVEEDLEEYEEYDEYEDDYDEEEEDYSDDEVDEEELEDYEE